MLVIRSMLLVSVASEVTTAIISPLIMEAAPGSNAVLVSSCNWSLINLMVRVCDFENLVCMAVPDIKMFRKWKLNIFNLGPFSRAHSVACRL